MILNKFPAAIVLLFFLLATATASSEPSKNYLRIAQSKSTENNDLKFSSIGALVFRDYKAGHADLTYLESDLNGDSLALELGGGYVFNWNVSFFLGFGISLGFNSDTDDTIAAYYPEIGIVVDLTNTFGITVNGKRYHHLYEDNDATVMLGLVFRN